MRQEKKKKGICKYKRKRNGIGENAEHRRRSHEETNLPLLFWTPSLIYLPGGTHRCQDPTLLVLASSSSPPSFLFFPFCISVFLLPLSSLSSFQTLPYLLHPVLRLTLLFPSFFFFFLPPSFLLLYLFLFRSLSSPSLLLHLLLRYLFFTVVFLCLLLHIIHPSLTDLPFPYYFSLLLACVIFYPVFIDRFYSLLPSTI